MIKGEEIALELGACSTGGRPEGELWDLVASRYQVFWACDWPVVHRHAAPSKFLAGFFAFGLNNSFICSSTVALTPTSFLSHNGWD